MLVLLIAWILLLALAFAIGSPFVIANSDDQPLLESWAASFGAAWLGLLAIAWFFFALTMFAPLKGMFLVLEWGVVLTVALVLYKYANSRQRSGQIVFRPNAVSVLVFIALAALFAERSTWIGNLNDTGGYHWNIVQWFNEFGVVQGLGLFQIRLATSSSWLALTAALNAGALEGRVLTIVNGALFLASLGLFVVASLRLCRGSVKQSDWFIAAALLFLLPTMLRWEMRLSPSPDVPILIAPLIFSWYLLRIAEMRGPSPKGGQSDPWFLLVVFSSLAVTVKLNAAPLLFVGLTAYLIRDWNGRISMPRVFWGGLCVAAVLSPLIATSLITTGCVLFPSPVGCFNLPFGIGAETAREYSRYIRLSAPWDINGLLWISGVGLVAVIAGRKRLTGGAWWVVFLAMISIVFVLVFAPTSRFGRGYLSLLPALMIAVHRESIARTFARIHRWAPRLVNGVSVALVTASFALALYKDLIAVGHLRIDESINAPGSQRLLLPSRLDYRGAFTEQRSGGLRYAVAPPSEATCWNHPIPCASNLGWPLIQEFRLRDPQAGIGSGFYRR